MVNVNDFNGPSDSEIIEKAIESKTADGIVVIPPRTFEREPERRTRNLPDSIANIAISNVICNRTDAVSIEGDVTDSVICSIINRKKGCHAVKIHRADALKNTQISNLTTIDAEPISRDY